VIVFDNNRNKKN